jgi:hypothetical protein
MEAKALLIHPPYQGVCGWHGTEEQCVTSGRLVGSLGGARSKQTDKREAKRQAMPGQLADGRVVPEAGRQTSRPSNRRRNGPGKAAGEDGREERGCKVSKDALEEQFHE